MERRQERQRLLWPLTNQTRMTVEFVLMEVNRGIADGKSWSVKGANCVMTDDPGDGSVSDPTFSLRSDEVQTLVDQLYQLGYRPSKGVADPHDALDSVRYHLEDMRRIVYRDKYVAPPTTPRRPFS